jgi:hypothetical protein
MNPLFTNRPPAITRFCPCMSIPASNLGLSPRYGILKKVRLPPLKPSGTSPTFVKRLNWPLPTAAGFIDRVPLDWKLDTFRKLSPPPVVLSVTDPRPWLVNPLRVTPVGSEPD